MSDINQIISELYIAFNEKDLEKGNLLIQKAKELDQNNVYLKKYIVLFDGLKNNTHSENIETKIIQIRGVTLKCKKCNGNIGLTSKNLESIKSFKENKKNQLEVICNYCNTKNFFKNNGRNADAFNPLYLDIYIGKELTLNKKTYSVIGGVKYEGTWKTKNSGSLTYIERVLTDKSGDIYYYSESLSNWSEGGDYGVEKETEISRKIIPDFNLKIENNFVTINNTNIYYEEICKVKVIATYGENTKSFTIGDKITTKQFRYKWIDYILENESTKNQKEIGIYETNLLNNELGSNLWSNLGILEKIGRVFLILFGIFVLVCSFLSIQVFMTVLFAIGTYAIVYYFKIAYDSYYGTYKIYSNKITKTFNAPLKVIFGFILGLFVINYLSFLAFNHEYTINSTNLEKIINSPLEDVIGLYKIDLPENLKQKTKSESTIYGEGKFQHTITKSNTLEGLKFRIESQSDIELLKKIYNNELVVQNYSIDENYFDFSVNKFSDYFKDLITYYK